VILCLPPINCKTAWSTLEEEDRYIQFVEPDQEDQKDRDYRLVLVDLNGTVADTAENAVFMSAAVIENW
jgi:hypothetical protein